MTAATPATMASLFTAYYTANPITSTTVVTAFNDTEVPAYTDITDSANNTNYNHQIAVSNYSQTLTLSTDDSVTTQWGVAWSLVLQSNQWTATGTEVYTQYFSPKYATDSTQYANYVCSAAQDGSGYTVDDAAVSTVKQVTATNWETNY